MEGGHLRALLQQLLGDHILGGEPLPHLIPVVWSDGAQLHAVAAGVSAGLDDAAGMAVRKGVEFLPAVPAHPADPVPVHIGLEPVQKAVLLLKVGEGGLGVLAVDIPHVVQGDEFCPAPAVALIEVVEEVVGDGAAVDQKGPQIAEHQPCAGVAQLLDGVAAHLVEAVQQTFDLSHSAASFADQSARRAWMRRIPASTPRWSRMPKRMFRKKARK